MYVLQERVGASRTDKNGVIRLVSALDIIQDCSLLWMESEPSFQDFLNKNNLGMFLVSRQADVVRLPVYGERVTARTSIYDCRSYYGFRNTVLYGEDGLPCVLTWSIGAFVDFDTGKMARLPVEELQKVTMDDKVDMEYLDKKIVLPDIPALSLGAVPVRRADIDLYGHMNNARYVETALELLPDDAPVRRLRVEYKSPAKPGELLAARLIDGGDGKRYVLLSGAENKLFSVMEFTY